MSTTTIKTTLAVLALAFLASCGTAGTRTMPAYPHGPQKAGWDERKLSRIVNEFYGSSDAKDAQRAVEEATEVAPNAPATHEIAGRLAFFEGNEDEAWRHFYLALASPANEVPYLHLVAMMDVSMTTDQYREALALFRDIAARHRDENLRRIAAAYVASWERRLNGDPVAAEAALDKRGLLENFALISPFGNEDGKGFASEYPPERELDYDAEYEGTQFPATWRRSVPTNHQRNLDLGDLVSPGSWVTAYANTYVKVPEEGNYLLRVTTTDPIRLWVNDIEVLTQQKVGADAADQFTFPVLLRGGWNRILLKSCHESGGWQIGLALTGIDGSLIEGLENTTEPQEVKPGPPPGPGYDFESDLEWRLGEVREPLRKLFMAIELAEAFGLSTQAQNLSDIYRSALPDGMFSLYKSAMLAWSAGQRGGTIDVLEHLIERDGERIPRFYLLRASFFQEQGRTDKAREDLLSAVRVNDAYRTAHLRLADNYRREGWLEDYLAAQLENRERWPSDTRVLWGLAGAYQALGRREKSEEIHREILGQWKGAEDILQEMISTELRRNHYRKAIRYRETICEVYPNTPTCYYELGNLLRQAGREEEAAQAYDKARDIDGRWSAPIVRLGEMAYEEGNTDEAVRLWKEGLEYDPNNHSLADRVEFVAPTDAGLLAEFVPTKDRIREVLANRGQIDIDPGANLAFLLDHAVEQVEADGSSRQVVTQIIMVANDTGRDQLTQYSFPWGRLKVMEAYVIDPDGTRREASSLRGRKVRFRELKMGSTVVVQYRLSSHPTGYLARYIYRRWFFHGVGNQFLDSRFDLILPEETKIKEWGHGKYDRTETPRGDRKVITYQARNVHALIGEPAAPPVLNLLDQVVISSIPDWGTIADWDKALLVDAFRTTPRTEELAEKLTAHAKTPREKIDAITRFVMREIRYQQDYENTIAGVKPHTASVVLQRGYGDCKDKSVLIMTLAKELGIETRFAILRTTTAGDFIKELPFLQFNHAIVYVPAQEGIEDPFFVDATPDTLDLATLRPDDQGTWALTINPDTGDWKFVEIPMQPGTLNFTIRNTTIEPGLPGEEGKGTPSKVKMKLVFQGPSAASIRQILRNPDETQVFASQLIAQLFVGAQLEEIDFEGHDDIVKPLTLSLEFTTEQLVRPQGDTVIVDVPNAENLSQYASLSARKLPMQTGIFLSYVENEDTIAIPEGYSVKHMPEKIDVDTPFFRFEREARETDGEVKISLRFTEKATRVEVDEYPAFRKAVAEISDNLKQDLVLEPTGKKRRKGSGKNR